MRSDEKVSLVPRLGSDSRLTIDLSRENLSRLMNLLSQGVFARTELAASLGLSAGSVTRLVSRLINCGLVTDVGSASLVAQRGRPRRFLSLNADTRICVALHIGATRLTGGLIDIGGHVDNVRDVMHIRKDPVSVLTAASAMVESLQQLVRPQQRIIGLGVSIGGWVDGSVVIEHPVLPWHNVELGSALEGVSESSVIVESHVRGLVAAEQRYGAAAGLFAISVLHIGNVTDSATVIGGVVLRGPQSAAGSVGHWPLGSEFGQPCRCGRRGCAQVELSDATLFNRAKRAGLQARTINDLAEASRAGDRVARIILEDRARSIGRLCAILLDLVNPDLLILEGLGGAFGIDYFDLITDSAQSASATKRDTKAQITISPLKDEALVLAAGMSVIDRYLGDPSGFDTDLDVSKNK